MSHTLFDNQTRQYTDKMFHNSKRCCLVNLRNVSDRRMKQVWPLVNACRYQETAIGTSVYNQTKTEPAKLISNVG